VSAVTFQFWSLSLGREESFTVCIPKVSFRMFKACDSDNCGHTHVVSIRFNKKQKIRGRNTLNFFVVVQKGASMIPKSISPGVHFLANLLDF
jgi:hypothetical protein